MIFFKKTRQKLYCKFFGHSRGKRVAVFSNTVTLECPFCGTRWTRKLRRANEHPAKAE